MTAVPPSAARIPENPGPRSSSGSGTADGIPSFSQPSIWVPILTAVV